MQGFRALPSVDQLLQSETGLGLIAEHGRAMVTRTARARLDLARAAIRQGADGAVEAARLPHLLAADLAAAAQSGLRPILNLTGTILHTNLGRAILAPEAIE
ncbi:MAG TPA: L-seryl-tRNA(Sec) selenium transferase, partial [Paracoccus sp.]|nr:L-seryl-tRNA(Sec) selenium transferase [Paracoccus sp. (in: a-proteobacteria)]